MLGIFFDGPKGTFHIPGGISVKELVPEIINARPKAGLAGFSKLKKGETRPLRLEYETTFNI